MQDMSLTKRQKMGMLKLLLDSLFFLLDNHDFYVMLYYIRNTLHRQHGGKMFVKIDFGSSVPIYEQVVVQVKYLIATGAVQEGELIPSVRELAKSLTINPLTVSRAYRQLQDDQLLEVRRGLGLAVAAGAVKTCRAERIEILEERLERILDEAIQSRLDVQEIKKIVERCLTTAIKKTKN